VTGVGGDRPPRSCRVQFGVGGQARQDPAVTQAVAQSLGWNRGRRPLAEGELELLEKFATDADPVVRQAPAVVAERLAIDDPTVACHLVAAVDFSDSPRLADEVFMCFLEPSGLKWEMLTETQVATIRQRLVALPGGIRPPPVDAGL
jgi:hypothetical protein